MPDFFGPRCQLQMSKSAAPVAGLSAALGIIFIGGVLAFAALFRRMKSASTKYMVVRNTPDVSSQNLRTASWSVTSFAADAIKTPEEEAKAPGGAAKADPHSQTLSFEKRYTKASLWHPNVSIPAAATVPQEQSDLFFSGLEEETTLQREAEMLPWYFGRTSREAASSVLVSSGGGVGGALLRMSNLVSDHVVLSVVTSTEGEGHCAHYILKRTADGVLCFNGKILHGNCTSLVELLYLLRQPNADEKIPFLTNLCINPDFDWSLSWICPPLFTDEEVQDLLSKSAHSEGKFLLRPDADVPGRVVLSVCHNFKTSHWPMDFIPGQGGQVGAIALPTVHSISAALMHLQRHDVTRFPCRLTVPATAAHSSSSS
jgi:hypothetical protein